MKKLLAILFALLILLSGMHLSIAIHHCGGKVAAVKWSVTGAKASCGMETDKQACTSPTGVSSNCCQDKLSVYAVDANYQPTSFQNITVTDNLILVFGIPLSLMHFGFNSSPGIADNVVPNDIALTSAVSLVDICILRI